jgi:hypothetical protein
MRHAHFLLAVVLLGSSAKAQGTADDYRRSEELNRGYQNLATGLVERPTWIGNTSRLWYRVTVPGGARFVVADAATRQKRPAFDHDKLAAALSGDSARYTAVTLPFMAIEFVDDEKAVTFTVAGFAWKCVVATSVCAKGPPVATGGRGGRGAMPWVDEPPMPLEQPSAEEVARNEEALSVFGTQQQPRATRPSPDSSMEAFIDGFNLTIRRRSGSAETFQLSTDGTAKTPYVFNTIAWSPDSRKIVAYKLTQGSQRRVYFVLSSPADQVQPKLDSTPPGRLYQKPGDVVDLREPVLFDVATRKATVIDRALFPNPYAISRAEWYADSRAFTFEDNERGHQTYRVIEVSGETGAARAVITNNHRLSSTTIPPTPVFRPESIFARI